jgi:carbonic anhydrase
VFLDPIEPSPEQIAKLAALFPDNARPIEQQNSRSPIETSF